MTVRTIQFVTSMSFLPPPFRPPPFHGIVAAMKRLAFALAAAATATSALADPLSDALGASGDLLCFTRAYDAAWLKAHPGQSLREAKLMVSYRDSDPWPGMRMSLKSARRPLYLFGDCAWGDAVNRGVQNDILIDSFKPESGVGCMLFTDVTGASAEEGGYFVIDWQDGGNRIVVHLQDGAAVWRSVDAENHAEFVDFKPADRVIRLDRAPAAACDDLAKFPSRKPE